MPYIVQEEYEKAEERVRAGRAWKTTQRKCRYGVQLCVTCKYRNCCEGDGAYLAARGF